MLVTKIEVQKNNKDRVNIYSHSEYIFSCFNDLIYKYNIKENSDLDIEVINRILKEEEYLKCKNYSFRVLDRSFKTEKQLRLKLVEKGYNLVTINEVIEYLKSFNFIDDEKYAQLYVESKVKTAGVNKIKRDLRYKGVEEQIITNILEKVSQDEEFSHAKHKALIKYNALSKREQDKLKLYRKLVNYLMGKGYNYQTSKLAVKEILDYDQAEEYYE